MPFEAPTCACCRASTAIIYAQKWSQISHQHAPFNSSSFKKMCCWWMMPVQRAFSPQLDAFLSSVTRTSYTERLTQSQNRSLQKHEKCSKNKAFLRLTNNDLPMTLHEVLDVVWGTILTGAFWPSRSDMDEPDGTEFDIELSRGMVDSSSPCLANSNRDRSEWDLQRANHSLLTQEG